MWDVVSYSPLRVSLAGGGTDIPPYSDLYGSAVVNATIDRGVTLKYNFDEKPLEISSRDFFRSSIIGKHTRRKGLQEKLADLFTDFGIGKGRLLINSDVPPGSGLGSSSSLILAALNLIHSVRGETVSREELAGEAYRLEKEYFGITLGKQDPYAIAFGGFKYMQFSKDAFDISFFDESSDFINKLQSSMLLVYTGKTRESSRILKDQVTRSGKGDKKTIERLDKVKQLAAEMKVAIEKEDLPTICSIINRGWELKKSLGSQVSNPSVDNIIEKAFSYGALAARLLGGGSQGFVLVISDPGNVDLQKEMLNHSTFAVRVSFDRNGSRISTQ
ncbi:MAG: kinase [Candidatus Thermoplasmatota archaeon]|nr:kinase [Candidatus Thermoplasmatota archaeon]